MKRTLFFIVLATAAIGLGLILGPSLARGVKKTQQTAVPVAEARGQKELTRDQLKNFPGMAVYWLGEEYQGLKLVKIQWVRNVGLPGVEPAVEYVQVIYASCKPGHPAEGGLAEGYCPEGELPTFVSVRTDWFCLNQPSFLAPENRRGSPKIGSAKAQFNASGDLHLYGIGESTVIVSSSEGDEEPTKKAAEKLKAVNALAYRPGHAAPMREEDCAGFVLPDPPLIPTAIPTETPTAGPTATPTVEPVASPTLGPMATIGPTPEATIVVQEGM